MKCRSTHGVALLVDELDVEVIGLEQLQFAHHLLEQQVPVRLVLQRETIVTVSPGPQEQDNSRKQKLSTHIKVSVRSAGLRVNDLCGPPPPI